MKIKNLYAIIISLTSLLLIEAIALGDAPVVDITQKSNSQETSDGILTTVTSENFNSSATEITPPDSASSLPTQPLTDTQRMARLEQQIKNLTNINLPQQIIDLQQQLAQVRGQLQEQQHDLQLVNKQLRTFYNNLNERIIQLKNLNSDTLNDNSSSQKTTGNSFSNNGNIQLQDSTAYQIAINFLNKNQYDKSLAAFQNYLNNYPNGNYVANAHYWLGEIYLEQNNRKKAVLEFQIIKNKFPQSEKVLDAQLKLAMIHAENGQVIRAKQELMEIKKQHPNSTVAQLASICLQQLESPNASLTNSLL